jgi:2-polyprenyl-3-methyl-5-hydroxy-6-metoxy-1,4-benzoquinol methylase
MRLHPPLSKAELASAYGAEYYDACAAAVSMSGGDETLAPHLAERLRNIEVLVRGRDMLEIGCGKGFFIEAAMKCGWTVTGVELSAHAAGIAKKKVGDRVIQSALEDAGLPSGRFDCIHVNHVLEHLADPPAALCQLCAALKPSGLLVVEVPNEFHNLFCILGSNLFPTRTAAYSIPSVHQHFFTPDGLERIVRRTGLGILRLSTPRWEIGRPGQSSMLRMCKRIVHLIERPFRLGGAIEIYARRP